MNFDQVRTIIEIAKHNSFSRAADHLYRTQPAISKQVRSLEQELGQRLFDRTGKQVELTPAGRILLEHCLQLAELRRQAQEAIERLRHVPRGRLAVGANEATSLYVLPPVFAEFRRRYPEVRVRIHRNFTRKLVERVLNNTLDFAVVSLPVEEKELAVLPVFRDELAVIVPPKHPLAAQRSVTIEQLAEHRLIVPRTGRTRALFEGLFASRGLEPRISLELASVEAIKKFVSAGLGVSLISRSFAAHEAAAGLLRVIPLEGIKLIRELGLIHHRDKSICPVLKAFLSVVEEVRPRLLPNSAA
jgi:DNA-binding transcriptional LysR family regulator